MRCQGGGKRRLSTSRCPAAARAGGRRSTRLRAGLGHDQARKHRARRPAQSEVEAYHAGRQAKHPNLARPTSFANRWADPQIILNRSREALDDTPWLCTLSRSSRIPRLRCGRACCASACCWQRLPRRRRPVLQHRARTARSRSGAHENRERACDSHLTCVLAAAQRVWVGQVDARRGSGGCGGAGGSGRIGRIDAYGRQRRDAARASARFDSRGTVHHGHRQAGRAWGAPQPARRDPTGPLMRLPLLTTGRRVAREAGARVAFRYRRDRGIAVFLSRAIPCSHRPRSRLSRPVPLSR